MAVTARMVRSSMLDVLGQDYIRTARAKGVRERAVVTPPRAAQRADPDRDDGRPADRPPDRRRGHHRDIFGLPGRRAAGRRRDLRARLPGRSRAVVLLTALRLPGRQPGGRRAVRLPRPAHPVRRDGERGALRARGPLGDEVDGARRSAGRGFLRRLLRRPPLGVGLAHRCWPLLLCAATADLIAPYDPLKQDLLDSLAAAVERATCSAPTTSGRDVLSRVIYGARDLAAGRRRLGRDRAAAAGSRSGCWPATPAGWSTRSSCA